MLFTLMKSIRKSAHSATRKEKRTAQGFSLVTAYLRDKNRHKEPWKIVVVSYCEPLATQVEDPALAGRWGVIGFRSIEVLFFPAYNPPLFNPSARLASNRGNFIGFW